MIDPTFPAHRSRLASSLDYWHREYERYRRLRRKIIVEYVGSKEYAVSHGMSDGCVNEHWGNLVLLAARAQVISLAYGNPECTCIPIIPEADHVAPRLEEFLNRYPELMNLRAIVQAAALDAFCGWGIVRVDNGFLPPSVRHRVRLPLGADPVGPVIRRVSQDHYLLDGSATSWDELGYEAHLSFVPLDTARSFAPFLAYNPEATEGLAEYGYSPERISGQLHDKHGLDRTPMAMTRLLSVYLPHAGVRAVWPAHNDEFGEVSGQPLLVTEWKGHHSGPYAKLCLLDVPDNLIPLTRIEQNLNWHRLFNELADKTAEAARAQAYHPLFETGNQADAKRIDATEDHKWVGVSHIDKLGQHVIPGPDQGVTSTMTGAMGLFKEHMGNLDSKLGLAPTDDTATGQQIIAARTTADSAEEMERTHTFVESIFVKLAHLALNDNQLTFPMRRPLPLSSLIQDVSWLPFSAMPRPTTADSYAIKIVPEALRYRSPEQRLQALRTAIGMLAEMGQVGAMGLPIDMIEVVDTVSRYAHLPELRKWLSEILPEYAERKERATMALRRQGVGQYVRKNVSERTNAGQIAQAFQNMQSAGAAGPATGPVGP